MARKQKTKAKQSKKNKMPTAFKPVQRTYDKKEIVALILALAAVTFLILNSIYFLAEKDTIIQMLGNQDPSFLPGLTVILIMFSIIWIVFSILMLLTIYEIEKNQRKWSSLLIISILSLFALRIDAFVLGTIASILYRKNHR
jgi:hypothetical protein